MNVLQRKGERAEARLLARASFLHSIPRVRPSVVKDLWRTALPEFKGLVLLRLNQEIFEGIDKDKFLKEKEEQFLEAPERCGDYLVHLLQQKLSPRFTALGTVPDSVRHEFFSTYVLSQAQDCKLLLTRIQEWSRRWNLDADWCRDHALATLRAWLFTTGLRWVDVFPARLWSIQREGWKLAVSNLKEDAFLSGVLVELDIDAANDKRLEVRLPKGYSNLSFEARWNFAAESEAQFRRRVQLDFESWLVNAESDRLRILRQDIELSSMPAKEFQRRLRSTRLRGRAGLTGGFDKALANYLTRVKMRKNKLKTKHRLVEGLRETKSEYLRWLILYQIPVAERRCLKISSIKDAAAKEGMWLSNDFVRKAIEKASKLIDLKRRDPREHSGRPRGKRGDR